MQAIAEVHVCVFATPLLCEGSKEELAGSLGSWGSRGLRGSQATLCTPTRAQGSWAAPALRHQAPLWGWGWTGHRGCGELETITPTVCPSLSSLTPSVKTSWEQPFPDTRGYSSGYLWSQVSPRGALLLGWDGATSWDACEVSPQTVFLSHLLVILCRNASFNVWWWEASLQVLPVSSGPGYLFAQAKGRAGSRARDRRCPNTCLAPFFPSLFWDLRARCCCPDLCFHAVVYLGYTQGLRAGLSPEKRQRRAWGWADIPLPRMQGPAGCHLQAGTRATPKRSSWKWLS